MGLGLLGGGTGDAEYMAKNGAEVLITDLKTEEQLVSSVEQLQKFPNISFRLGEHKEEDFFNRDFILKGPSVPLSNVFIETARKNNVPVDMSASLMLRIAHVPAIGVTGTRGKSTVVHFLSTMLEKDGRAVLTGGNVKGLSSLALLDQVEADSVGVFELDSWKCQGFGEERSLQHDRVQQGSHSPQVAVFTTFMPDHMNYYKGDMGAYLADKANIFLHQSTGDVLVIGKQALPAVETYKKHIKADVVVADESSLPKGWKVGLLGEHNRYNAGVAVATARAFGVDDEVIREVVETMLPLPGRLELVGEKKGVRFYNDTNATTPEATMVALRALKEVGPIRLITGGTAKDLDAGALLPLIGEYTEEVVFLDGSGTRQLLNGREDRFTVVNSLQKAFSEVISHAKEGDSILFSPAFSSFEMFANEFDRGEQFNALVTGL